MSFPDMLPHPISKEVHERLSFRALDEGAVDLIVVPDEAGWRAVVAYKSGRSIMGVELGRCSTRRGAVCCRTSWLRLRRALDQAERSWAKGNQAEVPSDLWESLV